MSRAGADVGVGPGEGCASASATATVRSRRSNRRLGSTSGPARSSPDWEGAFQFRGRDGDTHTMTPDAGWGSAPQGLL